MAQQDRALTMLQQGIPPVSVAAALGVTESYISQLMSDEEFAHQVQTARVEATTAQTERDAKYDRIEDTLIDKLEESVAYLVKPGEILKATQMVNQMKRRGTDTVAPATASATQIVQLILPQHITTQFTYNANGQVVEAEHVMPDGSQNKQTLVTIQSNKIEDMLPKENEAIIDSLI